MRLQRTPGWSWLTRLTLPPTTALLVWFCAPNDLAVWSVIALLPGRVTLFLTRNVARAGLQVLSHLSLI